MGDRTWFRINIKTEDVLKIKQTISEFEYMEPEKDDYPYEGATQFYEDEMNYGGSDLQQELEKARFCFMGEHGDGGGYDGYQFACFFGEFAQLPNTKEMGPVAPVNDKGELLEDWKERVINYFRICSLVQKYFKGSDDPEFLRQLAIKIMAPNNPDIK
jgi:hypothetical protein